MGFFFVLMLGFLFVCFIALKLTDLMTKKKAFGFLGSWSLLTVKLYIEPCAGKTIAFQLLLAQLCTLQTKEKAGY